jgi:hypothetical protein
MNKLILTAAILLTASVIVDNSARAASIDPAIEVMETAPATVQVAMYHDVCVGDDSGHLSDHRPGLSKTDAKVYDRLSALIVAAFEDKDDDAVRGEQITYCVASEVTNPALIALDPDGGYTK